MMGKRNRYQDRSNIILTEEGMNYARKILEDSNYEKKVNEVMAIMQGRRIAGKQSFNSPVWRD